MLVTQDPNRSLLVGRRSFRGVRTLESPTVYEIFE
jgi:hypothetical protein